MAYNGDRTEFQVAGISDIGAQTLNQQQEWDRIWQDTFRMLKSTAAEAIDSRTGMTLDQRNDEYNRLSVQYTGVLTNQGQVVNQIGATAQEFGQAMINALRGGR